MRKTYDGIILAGGKSERFGESEIPKPLIEIKGKTMLEYTIQSLENSSLVEPTVLVMAEEVVPERLKYKVLAIAKPGSDISQSIRNGRFAIIKRPKSARLLLITADTPLVTGKMVDEFISVAIQTGADLSMPIVGRRGYERKFPNSKRRYVRIKGEGFVTLGNMCLVKTDQLNDRAYKLIGVAAGLRKSPIALAKLLGIKILLAMLFRRLTLKMIEERISEKLGMKVVAIGVPYPEMGYDVDTKVHAENIKQYF